MKSVESDIDRGGVLEKQTRFDFRCSRALANNRFVRALPRQQAQRSKQNAFARSRFTRHRGEAVLKLKCYFLEQGQVADSELLQNKCKEAQKPGRKSSDSCAKSVGDRIQELGGGSRRIHVAKMQEYVMREILEMTDEGVGQFSHLLEALRAGCPPHAGFALGFDRLVAVFTHTDSVRDVIAFPKSMKGEDLMVGSPGLITTEQGKTYHLMERRLPEAIR